MRLSFKMMSIVFLGILVLLVIDAYLSVQREIELFTNDVRHDALLLGRATKQLVSEAWQHGGQDHALGLIESINHDEKEMQVRWIWLEAGDDDRWTPRVARAQLDSVKSGHETFVKQTSSNGSGFLYTYIPISLAGHGPGALEIGEPLTMLNNFKHRVILRSTVLTGALVLVGGLLVWILSIRFVVHPLNKLTSKTQRIGAGDLSADLVLDGHDELSDLATAMNRMCEQLTHARDAVHKETEARISTLEQLRHSERLATIGQLAAGMAHELGTPLNIVAGRAKLMTAVEFKPAEIAENSRIIREQVDRMTKIMRQLLDFARRQTTTRLLIDMRQVVRQVIDMLQATANKNRVNLVLTESGEAFAASIDQEKMQQVLTNLMMNGIQAMPNGGQLQVGIGTKNARPRAYAHHAEKKYLTIAIRDAGVGIAEENRKHIFEPFFTTKEAGRGTGLGLSIAHGIVEEHGGWIGVESEPGKGSCFTVYLPAEA